MKISTIHYDPIVTSDAAVGILRSRLMEKARQMDPRLSIHDPVSYTHLDVYKRQVLDCRRGAHIAPEGFIAWNDRTDTGLASFAEADSTPRVKIVLSTFS